jgi:2,3-bisphosphoglycerate-independent phosphoglycerate mutase
MTFFFSGGREDPLLGRSASYSIPRVATRSAAGDGVRQEVTDPDVEVIDQQRFDVIVLNYASGDMVDRW